MMRIANAIRSRQEYSRFMGVGTRRATWLWALAALAVGVGLLVSACGSGGESADQGDEPTATGTERSERADRQASIMQQQDQQSAAESEQIDQVDASDDTSELQANELGEIDFGHREGLPFIRNVVGDPEAPVVIVEYSDFQ